ncbi:hypothetical protein CBR_g22421 [Chara braunii]|uniref:Uncharacterized protein n=1 Tax=Chara braunii TaxID=69332 RepID=A0A388JV43_CHABU|nr:hypothetical protein CBR_g22421 [Chara braunii]|eukprot:GBG61623.1 hypothetical protein CBR_g22421 [Chara braunii]
MDMSTSAAGDDGDLDDLLNSALDEFQRQGKSLGNGSTNVRGSTPVPLCDGSAEVWQRGTGLADGAPVACSSATEFLPDVQGLGGKGLPALAPDRRRVKKPSGHAAASAAAPKGGSSSGVSELSGRDGVSATLQALANQTRQTVDRMDPNANEDATDQEFVEKLMQQFEALGGSQDIQGLMETMIKQLLSKEVLHAPMMEISERYPVWLEANKSKISEEDYKRYAKQLELMRSLCEMYDTRPDDFERIMELMQQMQDCGNPPSEIMKELAPGLDVGKDGLPVLPDLSALAGMAGGGAGGLPDLGGQDVPPQCTIS